jgi:neutral/alkaline ceramidase-like enzyme
MINRRKVPAGLWFPSSSLGTHWTSSRRSVSKGSQAGAWESGQNQASPKSVTVKRFPASVLLLAMFALLCIAGSAVAEGLEAGVARVDLTPPEDLQASLGGYGERMSRPAEGVHDRIFAKALVVSDGSKRFAMVTADILAFPPPFKPALVERLSGAGWTSDQIMLLPSHSHTSIDMSAINRKNVFGVKQIGIYQPELLELVTTNLAQVIQEAAEKLVPVVVGTSSKQLDGWNRNRRRDDGPSDPELIVTRIDTRDGQPLAVLFNFTAHPTMMGAEHMLFSGGWPGHAQRTLEALVGGGVTAMYFNGAQGDQSPAGRPDSGPSRWEAAERYGRELGIQVWRTWEATKTVQDVALDYHAQSIELPRPTWHADFMRTGGEEYKLTEDLLTKMLPMICPPRSTSISVQLGELVVVGIPGEATAELGLKIKAEAIKTPGSRYVAIGGLADEWISYILTEDQYREGGYEASVSFYGPTLGKTVVDGALAGVKNLGK